MLHNGTAYLLDHQGRDDNEQIYRNLQLHLNPLDQSPNVKRKAKSVTELARSVFPADHAELQWRQSRGLTALLMALAGHFIKSGKTAARAIFNVIATDVAVWLPFLWRRRLPYAGG